ncbi:hypothetical protein BJV77DRAFT_241823 [Russula vinacea]|nr:hypothetical protein BJV77DRAFT_241823 [Russula vinacea]
MGRDIPPPRTIESVRWSHGKPRQRSTTLRLPAVANVITHAPLFSMSSVANDPRPEHLEPAITMRKHEYARSVEFLHDTGAPSVFSSTEDCAELANDLDISTQGGQLWSSIADPEGSIAPNFPALMDPTSMVGPCVGPPSSTYSYTTPFSNNLRSSKRLCLLGTDAASTSTHSWPGLGQSGLLP